MSTPELLSNFERCNRMGFWTRDYRRDKMTESEMILSSLKTGFTTTRKDHGMAAGEKCYDHGSEPGLISKQQDVHSQVVHLSALSDILATAIRTPQERPWLLTQPLSLPNGLTWNSDAFISPDGGYLRRVAVVSNWSEDRHFSECRSWESLGNICLNEMPMQMVVAVLGQSRNGKRHSFWTHGLRHPANKKLRFRKKKDLATGFKNTWTEVWREDYDEISTNDWLTAMLEDQVVQDLLFKIDIAVPEKVARQKIIDLAMRRLDKLVSMRALPDQQLSTCDWPTPCDFRLNCHRGDQPGARYGFVSVDSLASSL